MEDGHTAMANWLAELTKNALGASGDAKSLPDFLPLVHQKSLGLVFFLPR